MLQPPSVLPFAENESSGVGVTWHIELQVKSLICLPLTFWKMLSRRLENLEVWLAYLLEYTLDNDSWDDFHYNFYMLGLPILERTCLTPSQIANLLPLTTALLVQHDTLLPVQTG